MTEHQDNRQEKAQLYFDYYDEIQDVQSAFENNGIPLPITGGTSRSGVGWCRNS